MSLVKLYTARDSLEAHYLRSLLAERGIAATVMGETLGAARGELPATQETLPSVWVNQADMEHAVPIARDLAESSHHPPTGEPWTCPNCGEIIEPQFAACWNCGFERAP